MKQTSPVSEAKSLRWKAVSVAVRGEVVPVLAKDYGEAVWLSTPSIRRGNSRR
jgi:hypothetical protein